METAADMAAETIDQTTSQLEALIEALEKHQSKYNRLRFCEALKTARAMLQIIILNHQEYKIEHLTPQDVQQKLDELYECRNISDNYDRLYKLATTQYRTFDKNLLCENINFVEGVEKLVKFDNDTLIKFFIRNHQETMIVDAIYELQRCDA